ncbi:unnamed protein product [Effrenium voratum]|uniref:Uncharacterized protein n=1 Tax=Effrenium voratum TaxID=2562239 RepID=A0AA36JMD7_9DINO|nr:unnamed protein product [Effrenium voratum]
MGDSHPRIRYQTLPGNASFDPLSSSDADVSDSLEYDIITPVGSTEGNFSYFLVYTKSVLVEQSTPVALSLVEASELFRVLGLTFSDYDLDEEELGGTLTWSAPQVMGEIVSYQIYLGYLDDQNLTLHDSLLTSVPSDQLTFVVPPDTATNGTSHLFIHSTSETVEHRTPSVVEFFDAEASVTGVRFTDLDLDANELGGDFSWTPPRVPDRVQADGQGICWG